MISGKEFIEICEQQDIRLHPEVLCQLKIPYPAYLHTSSTIEAIREAGMHSPYLSDGILSSGKVDLPAEITDTPARVLAEILNSAHNSVKPNAIPHFDHKEISRAYYCNQAEPRFFKVFQALGKKFLRSKLPPGQGVQIIMDDDQPIIVRKKFESSTGLTLAPVSIEGTVFPAGIIVGLQIEGTKSNHPLEGLVELVPKEAVRAANFKRLSMFALTQFERTELCGGFPDKTLREAPGIASFTMQDALLTTMRAVEKIRAG